VYEFYGASEGNLAFVNFFNFECTVGFCPLPYAIVKYDIDSDTPVLDANGFLVRVERGEAGLLIGKVTETAPFDGYTDPKASEKKLLRDVFEQGDVWFNSGDLLRDMGYRHAQFVDRLGDTFRWKGENVSTTEIEEVANGFEQVNETTVYGVPVPGADGRAGMMSVVAAVPVEQFDTSGFAALLRRSLPAYAVPVFMRMRSELEVTGTFKHRKVDLKKEGYDLEAVQDPLFVLLPGEQEYVSITPEVLSGIDNGTYRF